MRNNFQKEIIAKDLFLIVAREIAEVEVVIEYACLLPLRIILQRKQASMVQKCAVPESFGHSMCVQIGRAHV